MPPPVEHESVITRNASGLRDRDARERRRHNFSYPGPERSTNRLTEAAFGTASRVSAVPRTRTPAAVHSRARRCIRSTRHRLKPLLRCARWPAGRTRSRRP
jgi:hypothetical protein